MLSRNKIVKKNQHKLMRFLYVVSMFFLLNSCGSTEDIETSPRAINSNTTVVTALWLLDGAKYPASKYIQWMKEFFTRIPGNIVAYCDHRTCDAIREIIGNRTNVVLIDKYETPFSMPWIQPLERIYRQQQHPIDPERKTHIPELYAIWNSKTSLVMEVVEANPFNSEYFFWVDNGAFRTKNVIRDWPDEIRVNKVFSGARKDKILLGLISPLKSNLGRADFDESPVVGNYVGGGFFAGNADAVRRFHDKFWYYHNLYLGKGIFIGKDQTLMNSIVLRDGNVTVMESHLSSPECGDKWFYFLQFFAPVRSTGCNLIELRQF